MTVSIMTYIRSAVSILAFKKTTLGITNKLTIVLNVIKVMLLIVIQQSVALLNVVAPNVGLSQKRHFWFLLMNKTKIYLVKFFSFITQTLTTTKENDKRFAPLFNYKQNINTIVIGTFLLTKLCINFG